MTPFFQLDCQIPGKFFIYQISGIFARATHEVKIDNLTGCAIFSFQFISPSKGEERKLGTPLGFGHLSRATTVCFGGYSKKKGAA
jgi:hypothetical protein